MISTDYWRATHSVPRFEGQASRHHRDVRLAELRLRAAWLRVRGGGRARGIASLVQFVGFPRSGHTLIGSLIDAHPAACIAHELDVMGLIAKGFGQAEILALVRDNARSFTRHGRWWNGFSYAIGGSSAAGDASPLTVIGDKKGDWAVRRFLEEPELLERLSTTIDLPCKWILVTRDPYDNIATLTLRKGGAYDRLRVAHGGEPGFPEVLGSAQRRGQVAASVSDEMIADYRRLCEGVERMRERIAPELWHPVVYESFTERPRECLSSLLAFCSLDAEPALLADACALVKPGSRSRASLRWSDSQREAVRAMIERHDFLSAYRGAA